MSAQGAADALRPAAGQRGRVPVPVMLANAGTLVEVAWQIGTDGELELGGFIDGVPLGRWIGHAPTRLEHAAAWALEHFTHADRANAAMHMAPVKFSPITFELAHGLADTGAQRPIVREVLSHVGAYELDGGR